MSYGRDAIGRLSSLSRDVAGTASNDMVPEGEKGIGNDSDQNGHLLLN